jgi:hypothetical protein
MWDYFIGLFVHVGEFFWTMHDAEDRRERRRFVLGCGVVLLTAVGVIVFLATR